MMKHKRPTLILLIKFSLILCCCQPENEQDYTKVAGLWKCEEVDEEARVRIFNVDIDEVRNYENTYIISNFHDTGEDTFIRVSVEADSMLIPRQALINLIIGGSGIIASDFRTITLNYQIDDGVQSLSYISTFYR